MSFILDGFKQITPDEEEKLLEKLARDIVKMGLETPAIMYLETFKMLVPFGTQVFGGMAVPLLEFLGVRGYNYYQVFSKEGNVERLLQKIEQIVEQEKKSKIKKKTWKDYFRRSNK